MMPKHTKRVSFVSFYTEPGRFSYVAAEVAVPPLGSPFILHGKGYHLPHARAATGTTKI